MNTLKKLRTDKGLTQKQIADFLGVDRTTYVKYENGSSEPTFDTLLKLARYFKVSTDYLLGRSESPSVPAPLKTDIKDIADLTRDEVMELLNPVNQGSVVINIQNKGGENKAFEMDAEDFSEFLQLVELKKAMMRKELDNK